MELSEQGSDSEFYEIDCPVCDDGKKHKAKILRKMERGNRIIMEVECEDCSSKGIIQIFKIAGVEIYDF